jgi:Flp pilus assembly protein TadD
MEESSAAQMRLDSWKAIAQHLGRSCRTAQRWHAEFGLPVHHLGGDSGSVFAYSHELEAWFRNHGTKAAVETPAKPALIEMPVAPDRNASNARTHATGLAQSPNQLRSQQLTAEAYQRLALLTESNLRTIASLFHEAIDLDPVNAEAYAGLSHTLITQGMIGNLSLDTAYSVAEVGAARALELNPRSCEAACAKAWLEMARYRDWNTAGMLLERLLREGPVTTRVMLGLAFLSIAQGDCAAASDLSYNAAQQDSLTSLSLALHSWSDYLTGSFIEVLDHVAQVRESGCFGRIVGAVEALTCAQCLPRHVAIGRIRNLVEEDAKNQVARGVLGYLWGLDGNNEKAREVLRHLKSGQSHANVTDDYAIALTHLGLGETGMAIRHIKGSYQAGSPWSAGFHLDPALRPLEDQAEFNDFVTLAYPTSNRPAAPRSDFALRLADC